MRTPVSLFLLLFFSHYLRDLVHGYHDCLGHTLLMPIAPDAVGPVRPECLAPNCVIPCYPLSIF